MITLLKQNQLLLLFVVSAIGYLIGSIRIRGSRIGVAAVLFVGLGFGAIDPGLKVPEIVIFLGLTMFVYTIGLSSGPSFFATFQRRGFKDILFVIAMLTISALVTIVFHWLFRFPASASAGLFAGSSTNTPALAGLLDLLQNTLPPQQVGRQSKDAVVGYSISYPMGVLGVMLAISVAKRWMNICYKEEENSLRKDYPLNEQIHRKTIQITNTECFDIEIRDIVKELEGHIVFGRTRQGDRTTLAHWDTQLQENDLIVAIGTEEAMEQAIQLLGREAQEQISHDLRTYDITRIFVSNPEIVGKTLSSLNLHERFSAMVTRVQRGDIDLLASGNTILEFGDRVLLVSRHKDKESLHTLFGNSYESLSHVNLLSFGSGMALGLLLGMVEFRLPGGLSFRLGFAGGPMVVAILLGQLRRTGSIVWTLPNNANLTLRQFGLILLLAGIGIRSGYTFLQTILAGRGLFLFIAGTVLSFGTALCTMIVGHRMLNIPFSFLTGMVSNQPAVLDYAIDQSNNKLPTIGFAMILPVAMIVKILFVQLLYVMIRGM